MSTLAMFPINSLFVGLMTMAIAAFCDIATAASASPATENGDPQQTSKAMQGLIQAAQRRLTRKAAVRRSTAPVRGALKTAETQT